MPVHERHPHYLADQRRFFDELITEDWHTYESADWDHVRRFEVMRLFERVRPATVLDVGCGCGFHDPVMAAHDFVREVDAIDYSARSIARAEETYPHSKVRRWVADFLEMPARKPYDLIVSFQVFEHLDRPDCYFEAAARHLAETGRLAIFTPNRRRLDNVLRLLRGQKPLLCDPMHFREYTVGEVGSLARRAGFRPAGSFGIGLDAPSLAGLGIARRTAMGYWLPAVASGICVILERAPA
jgi:SAM-dependent methyltransferase